jgi:hypothetical protein
VSDERHGAGRRKIPVQTHDRRLPARSSCFTECDVEAGRDRREPVRHPEQDLLARCDHTAAERAAIGGSDEERKAVLLDDDLLLLGHGLHVPAGVERP